MNGLLLRLLAVYLGGLPAYAQTHLLSRGPGAEAAALAGSVVPTIADPTALYWNPAGLAYAGGAVTGEHLFLYDGARYDFVGLTVPSSQGTLGLGALQLDRSNIVARNAIDDPGTTVSNSESDYIAGFARRIGERFSAGAAANFLKFNLAGSHDMAFGLDLGAQGHVPGDDLGALKQTLWSFGAVLKNLLRPRFKLLDDSETLPRELRGGMTLSFKTLSRASMDSGVIRSDRAALSVSFRKVGGEPGLHPGFGATYTLENMLVLRAGYDQGISGGLGFRTSDGKFSLDYALEDKPLSYNHRFTVSYRFLKPSSPPEPAAEESDSDYAKTLARAQSLSQEHYLRGQGLFKDLKYGAALEPLRLASLLDPESREKAAFYTRAVEAARRDKLRDLSADLDAGMAPGREAAAYAAIARMLDLKPSNRPELLELLRKVVRRMPATDLAASSSALLEKARPAITRLSSQGLSSEALRLASNLELCQSSGTAGAAAQLKEQVEGEARALRARLEAEASGGPGKAYRALLALQRAFPEEAALTQRIDAARTTEKVSLRVKERLYLRRLYFLAAIQYANRNAEGAKDLLEEVLRRDAADPAAGALEDAMARANAIEDQLQ